MFFLERPGTNMNVNERISTFRIVRERSGTFLNVTKNEHETVPSSLYYNI